MRQVNLKFKVRKISNTTYTFPDIRGRTAHTHIKYNKFIPEQNHSFWLQFAMIMIKMRVYTRRTKMYKSFELWK